MSFRPNSRRRKTTGLNMARDLIRSLPPFKTGGSFSTEPRYKVPNPADVRLRRRSQTGNADELARSLWREQNTHSRMGF